MSTPAATGRELRLPRLGSPRGVLRMIPAEVPPVAVLAVAVWVAALAALPGYRVGGAPELLAGAAFGAAAVSLVLSRGLRLAAPAAYAGSLIALVALLTAAVGPDPAAVARSLVHGPNRVFTETLPLSGGALTLCPLTVLTWVAAGSGAELLIRAARSRMSLLALGIPVVLYVVCFTAASAAPDHDRAGGPAILLLLAVAAALRGPPVPGRAAGGAARPVPAAAAMMTGPDDPVPPSPWRPLAAGVVAVAAVAAALAFAAPAVPGLTGRPAALHRRPPLAVPPVVDPVDVMAQLRDGHPHRSPSAELRVRLSGPSTGYLALAYLGVYDGDVWQFTATFQPTGGRVPALPAGAQAVGDRPVTQQVVVTGRPPLPLLGALDRPASVFGPAVATDAATGMILPEPGQEARRYTVTSDAPVTTLTGLPAADGIDPALAPTADATIPANTSTALATSLRFLSGLAGQRPAPTVAYLQRVATGLRTSEKRIDPAASASTAGPTTIGTPGGPPTTVAPEGTAAEGTSLSEVIDAVTVNRAATPEQFATFYAMVARYLGVPARVVTGFRLAGSSAGRPLAAGTYQVTSRQAWAWVEVPVSGVGWVVVDPTPDASTSAAVPPPESVQAPATTVPPRPARAVPRNQINGGHALAPPARFRPVRHAPTAGWVWPVVAGAGLLLFAALGGPGQAGARRVWRRRARRSADPAELAVGAWLELLDGLDRAGAPTDPGSTNAEIASDLAGQFGAELGGPAAALAALADRALYCRAEPVDAREAEEAWAQQRSVTRRLSAGMDRRGRLRYALSVGRGPRRPVQGPAASAGAAPRPSDRTPAGAAGH